MLVDCLEFHDRPKGQRNHLGFSPDIQHILVTKKPHQFNKFWTSIWEELCTLVGQRPAHLPRPQKVITVLIYCRVHTY